MPEYMGSGAGMPFAGTLGGFMGSGSRGAGIDPKANLMKEFQDAFDKANAANESRYQEILGGYKNRRTRALTDLQGSGDQERKDIMSRFAGLGSRQSQDMVSRGLSGTTIKPTMEQGLMREQADATGALDERLRQQRIGLDSGLEQDTLSFMERRTDSGPDYAQLMALMNQMGQAGGGATISQGGYAGTKRESEFAKSGLTERRELPKQAAGEADAAYQNRVGQWSNWEAKNNPKAEYGDGRGDYRTLADATKAALTGPLQQSQRAGEAQRNAARNRPVGPFGYRAPNIYN